MSLARRFAIGLAFVLAIAVVLLLGLFLSEHPTVDVRVAALPASPDSSWPDEGWSLEFESATPIRGDHDYLFRLWSRSSSGGEVEELTQSIENLDGLIGARYHFWVNDPARAIREIHGGVSFDASEIVDSFADDSRLYCARGDQLSCESWHYWARYGQYVMFASYVGSDGMAMDSFEEYVDVMEQRLLGVLG